MEYREEILEAMRDEHRFICLTFSGPPKPAEAKWLKITVAPLIVQGQKKFQAVFQGHRKQVAENIEPDELSKWLDACLEMGFKHINLQSKEYEIHARVTRKGKVLISRGKPSRNMEPEKTAHDREKKYPFPVNQEDEFLETIGVMKAGRVLASMQHKFRQINYFLVLLEHGLGEWRGGKINIVDCGCGRAFLTLAAYHYLKHVRKFETNLVGVDSDAEVVACARELSKLSGYSEVEFVHSRILEYQPACRPTVILSLHACDTATDDAIAQGVKWGAELIYCAPCCQHELHHELSRQDFAAALRHGILRERLADIITDALRAAALRVMGYRTDVIEFISSVDTAKNIIIRARRTRGMPRADAVREYLALRDYWQVVPSIEKLLVPDFTVRLAR